MQKPQRLPIILLNIMLFVLFEPKHFIASETKNFSFITINSHQYNISNSLPQNIPLNIREEECIRLTNDLVIPDNYCCLVNECIELNDASMADDKIAMYDQQNKAIVIKNIGSKEIIRRISFENCRYENFFLANISTKEGSTKPYLVIVSLSTITLYDCNKEDVAQDRYKVLSKDTIYYRLQEWDNEKIVFKKSSDIYHNKPLYDTLNVQFNDITDIKHKSITDMQQQNNNNNLLKYSCAVALVGFSILIGYYYLFHTLKK